MIYQNLFFHDPKQDEDSSWGNFQNPWAAPVQKNETYTLNEDRIKEIWDENLTPTSTLTEAPKNFYAQPTNDISELSSKMSEIKLLSPKSAVIQPPNRFESQSFFPSNYSPEQNNFSTDLRETSPTELFSLSELKASLKKEQFILTPGSPGSNALYDGNNNKHKAWMSTDILEMIAIRDMLYRRMKKTPNSRESLALCLRFTKT